MRERFALAALLVGCGGASIRETGAETPEGHTILEARCGGGATSFCAEAARDRCGGGYEQLDSSSETGRDYVMHFRCGARSSGAPIAAKTRSEPDTPASSSGPSAGEVILSVLAGAAAGANAGMRNSPSSQRSQPSTYEPPRTYVQPSSSPSMTGGCSSDYECGVGSRCTKPAGHYLGTCATAVDQYGTPQPTTMPRSNSLGPGQRQCWTMADCPIGFQCDDGMCMKH